MNEHEEQARRAVTELVAGVQQSIQNKQLMRIMNYLAGDDAMPEEVADRLLALCNNDIDDVIRTTAGMVKLCRGFITEAAMHAVIKIKEGQ